MDLLPFVILNLILFQGTEIHRSDDTRQEACLSPETVLNKRLRVDKRNKLRTNFHRFQEIAR